MKVFARHNSGVLFPNATVRAMLTGNEEECPVTADDCGYFVSLIPQQLGQQQLSITVNGRYVQNSPFTLNIVPQRDLLKIESSVQTITGVFPRHIAFSRSGDMFVTSDSHCVHVYDESGDQKEIIGCWGSDALQFNYPYGIDIHDEVVYVAEYSGHRIHIFTTDGEFIDTFGKEGFEVGEFQSPRDVKIGPDSKMYVADEGNCRVQIFNPDWTIHSVIDCDDICRGVAVDMLGYVHVVMVGSESQPGKVSVFTSNGQHLGDHHYENDLVGIAIDQSGRSLYTSWGNDGSAALCVYDSNKEQFIQLVSGLKYPHGVSTSLVDGSIWVADTFNKLLVKF